MIINLENKQDLGASTLRQITPKQQTKLKISFTPRAYDLGPFHCLRECVYIVITRRASVQRAVEWDEIPYPYNVHDTTLRPLLNITIKSSIVVRSRSRSCGGSDICGTNPA